MDIILNAMALFLLIYVIWGMWKSRKDLQLKSQEAFSQVPPKIAIQQSFKTLIK